jgi:tRNA pseudouridine38-40 synthase
MTAGRRIKLTITYDGTHYNGWQVQPELPTIQGVLEAVFAQIEGAPVHVAGSGRTDAGVHALAQVAAVTIANPIPCPNLKKALNRLLPRDIRILAAEEVQASFHARYDAKSKTYEYRIWRSEVCSPFARQYVHHHPYPMSDAQFAAGARLLEGEYDFSAFAAADERDQLGRSKIRRIFSSKAERQSDVLAYRVQGSGFLKHMVRNICGTLIEYAKGNLDNEAMQDLLLRRSNRRAGPTAPPQGLFLIDVEY